MFDRISVNPQVMGGKLCVKGTRVAVYMVLELLENDLSFDDIINNYYPQLTKEDIIACIEYARTIVEEEEVHFASELVKS
ncbi:MAG: DUF433 domain-containing protein [Candidatus Poribacteria bacterium]